MSVERSILAGKMEVKVYSRKELEELIDETIMEEGPNCDLNFIEVSNIVGMADFLVGI